MTPLQSILGELRTRKRNPGNLVGISLGSAWEAIWANRTRSLLTVLGIIIGISGVIGALTLTQGVGTYIDNLIMGMGANTILIQSGSGGINTRNAPKVVRPLTQQDLLSLSKLPHVSAISPWLSSAGQVVYSNQNWRTRIVGCSTDLQTIEDWQLAKGLWFNSSDEAEGTSVAVIGDTVAQNLFGPSGLDPVGQHIRIGGQIFRVVGVLAPKGQSGFGVSDNEILIPYRTSQVRLLNNISFNEIDISADTSGHVDLVVQEITMTLEQNHRIARGGPDDFQIETSAQRLQQSNQEVQAITLLLTGIAAISLTVGGIGIMNIMLVSVTERTREIGIRISLGARRSDIRNQFLMEALFLCLLGGILGLILGVFLGAAMTNFVASAAAGSGGANGGGVHIPLVITGTTLLLPFAVSASVGLVFGLYPAIRASRLDPIVALRRAK